MIKLDMLDQIAFGNREYVAKLLVSAREEIRQSSKKLEYHVDMDRKELFTELHNLKTTLSMLQAGKHIQECQLILNRLNAEKSTDRILPLDRFLLSLSEIEDAIQAAIEKQ